MTRFAAWQAARLQAQAAMTRALCHDLRGTLAPGLLIAERLQASADPAQRLAGDRMAAMVARAIERLRPDHDAALELPIPLCVPIALDLLFPGYAIPPQKVLVQVSNFATVTAELTTHLGGAMQVTLVTTDRQIVLRLMADSAMVPSFTPPDGPDDPVGLALARDLLRGMGGDLRAIPGGPCAALEITLARG